MNEIIMEPSSPREIEKKLEALIRWRESYSVLLEAKQQQEIEIFRTKHQEANCVDDNLIEKHCSEESVPELSKQTSGYSTDSKQDVVNNKKVTRKFLRRGEGIKQRFKIEPDAFNLNNLPPYKYANAHPNLRKPSQTKVKRDAPKEIPSHDAPKEIPSHDVIKEIPTQNAIKAIPKHLKLDAQEQQFQRLLFESKSVANSTPDSKVASKSESQVLYDESQPRSASNITVHTTNSISNSIVWSKVLDPLTIKPIGITEFRIQNVQDADETEDEHLNLFELLEEKAKDGSFNMNSSVIKRILSNKGFFKKTDHDEGDSDIIPVSNEIREAPILPKVTVNVRLETSDSESDDSADDDDDDNYDDGDDSVAEEEENTDANDDNANNAVDEKSNERLHVRFEENCERTLEEDTNNTVQGENTLSDMNTEVFFEHAKEILRCAMSQNKKNLSEVNFPNNPQFNAENIKELAEKSKARLAELEHQIALMKENNIELMNAKRQHEMEKVAFIQEQEEAIEKFNDEKVKIEMELHDERMKLEEDRRKLEEKIRMQKASIVSAERKEITNLKDQISKLQMKLSEKDQNHMAAQGRLRAQLRCFEKEQKDLYAEIERLKKEIKKLEKQNMQLSRQQNMTMLNEINRNIVKLAETKNNTSPSEVPPKAIKNNVKKFVAPKPTVKKKIDETKVQNTLKITKSTFKRLLADKEIDEFEEIEGDSDENLEKLPKSSEKQKDQIASDGKSISETAITTDSSNNLGSSGSNAEENSKKDTDKDTSTQIDTFKVMTRESITEDGGKEILYPNGTLRKDNADGTVVRMMYFNGDVKETNVNEGTIKYYYSKTNTWHTTYLDGLEILEFPNGQIEHRHPNGSVEIHFPNNSVKIVDPLDEEKLAEWKFNDGTILHEMRNGERLLILSNGQKELHTKKFKRREYPDGTVKTVFPDGSYETRYSNGRIRLKDKNGALIMDSDM